MTFNEGPTQDIGTTETPTLVSKKKNEFQLLCEEIQGFQTEMDKLKRKVDSIKEQAQVFDEFNVDLENIREKAGSAAVVRNKLDRIEEKMNKILKIGKKFSRLEGLDFNPGDSIMSRHDFCLMLGRTDANGKKKPIAYNTMIRFVEQNPDGYEIIKMGSGRHGLTFIRIKSQLKVA